MLSYLRLLAGGGCFLLGLSLSAAEPPSSKIGGSWDESKGLQLSGKPEGGVLIQVGNVPSSSQPYAIFEDTRNLGFAVGQREEVSEEIGTSELLVVENHYLGVTRDKRIISPRVRFNIMNGKTAERLFTYQVGFFGETLVIFASDPQNWFRPSPHSRSPILALWDEAQRRQIPLGKPFVVTGFQNQFQKTRSPFYVRKLFERKSEWPLQLEVQETQFHILKHFNEGKLVSVGVYLRRFFVDLDYRNVPDRHESYLPNVEMLSSVGLHSKYLPHAIPYNCREAVHALQSVEGFH